ncbi:MAG: S8 family peptidase [Vulcanimicrobiota bacterium]
MHLMNIDGSRNTLSQHIPSSRPGQAAPKEDLTSIPFYGDVVLFGTTDLTNEGKVPLILSNLSGSDRAGIEKTLKQFKGKVTDELPLVDGFTVEISAKKIKQFLKSLPSDANIRVDNKLKIPDPQTLAPAPEVKGPPVESKNVYAETLGLDKVWAQGFTGKGVGVCVIDSGIYSHEDLDGRIAGWKDMSTEGKKENHDPFGHGTHVAGIIGGNGKASEGRISGVAPDAQLVGVRITSVSEAIKALQWAIDNKAQYGIKIINMSLGDYAVKSYKDDPWAQAAEKAIDAGIIVIAAAGNEGPGAKSISTPGTDPRVITVGAFDDKKTPQVDDDNIADFSSRGPTSVDNLSKPDLLAPGVNIFSTLSPGATLDMQDMPHIGTSYLAISGTSMATPIVSGIAALLLSANPNLTHDQIKEILIKTADKMPDLDNLTQGAGRVDPGEGIAMALAMAKGVPFQASKPQAAPAPQETKTALMSVKTAPRASGTTPKEKETAPEEKESAASAIYIPDPLHQDEWLIS